MQKKYEKEFSPWIENFCNLKENQVFCTIENDFIEDEFNLICFNFQFSDLENIIEIILNPSFFKKGDTFSDQNEIIELFYGLLHSRYIFTVLGTHKIFRKFSKGIFGICPTSACFGSNLLPFGSSDISHRGVVKYFCPKCKSLYKNLSLENKVIDGSFFGSSFLFFFLNAYPECLGVENFSNFIPRNFGFRFSEFYKQRKKPLQKLKIHLFEKKIYNDVISAKIYGVDIFWSKRNYQTTQLKINHQQNRDRCVKNFLPLLF